MGCGPIPHANPSISSVFGCIPLTVRWLRLYVLAIVSLWLSPSKPFNSGLFNCGWTVWLGLFVLAIAFDVRYVPWCSALKHFEFSD